MTRAALVGGRFEGGSVPFDGRVYGPDERSLEPLDLVSMLFGRVTGFDNQLFGLDVRVGLHGVGVPAVAYGEIALEDNERSFGDGAVQLGLLLAAGGDGPATGVRYEYTGIGRPGRWCAACDTLPAFWYQHTRFQSGWRVGEALLGHPLGGYGLEHRLEVAAFDAALGARVRVAGARLRRDRWNLLEAERPGWAWGLRGAAELRARGPVEVSATAGVEWGDAGWRAGSLGLLVGLRLAGGAEAPP